jgi:hypothetical protein
MSEMVSSIPEALCTTKPRAMMVVMDSVLDVVGEVRGRVRAPAPAAMLQIVDAQANTEATEEANLLSIHEDRRITCACYTRRAHTDVDNIDVDSAT